MKKIKIIAFILLLVLVAGCGKKVDKTGTSSGGSDKPLPVGTLPEKKVQSADDVIKEAENAHFSSGDASDESLYAGDVIPNDGIGPAFVQSHTPDEFPTYPYDEEFFTPDSGDYLIASFEKNKTIIYSFDASGECKSIRGRIVYESRDALLKANSDKNLTEGTYGEDGYTYKDSVLYYNMPEDGVFAASVYSEKYDLLKSASRGSWDAYTYWFSRPYRDVYALYDDSAYQEAVASMDYGEDTEGGEGQDSDEYITEDEVKTIIRKLMTPGQTDFNTYSTYFSKDYTSSTIQAYYNMAYRLPEEFEHTYFSIIYSDSEFTLAVQYSYTVPAGYTPGDKLDNFVFTAPLVKEDGNWVFATTELYNSYRAEYYPRILTEDANYFSSNGCYLYKQWIPFPMDDALFIDSVFYARVIEIYYDFDGNICATIYIANDLDNYLTLATVESLVILGDGNVVASVGTTIGLPVAPHQATVITLTIPPEYQNGNGYNNMSVGEFIFTTQY